MTIRKDNMDQVQDWGEALPSAWFHVRIKDVKEEFSKNSGSEMAKITMSVQDEPHVGRVLTDFASLQPQALAKLKAYYTATGQGIVDGGHDPELLKDGECYVKPDIEVYQGQQRNKIAPYNIKPLREGRPA